MDLMDIQPVVQRIADAIAAVLKIEVEIANHHFIRVAGTGEQKVSVLHKMEGDLVYQSAIRTGEPVIITNPGFAKVCERCRFFQNCSETGEICAPIKYEGQAIGVIGLLAFNEEQRQRLFENTDGILTFLGKMADLLSSKLHSHFLLQELTRNSEKMVKLMNLVNEGMIVIDAKGELHETNLKAELLLDLKNKVIPKVIQTLLQEFIRNEENQKLNITFPTKNGEKSLFLTKQKLSSSGHLNTEYLITLQDVNEIRTLAEMASEDQRKPFDKIIGVSTQMLEVKEYAFQVSQSDSTILIQGESGTGKEEFAKAIHFSSMRRGNPFITVNCGAIPENLLESELFGYERGAFTGANHKGKPGKFELAQKGTIFLDEIGEMPTFLQVKLLRVLQQKEIERLGGTSPIPVDVRVIAATNKDLKEMVNHGQFREDLFFRLNVIPIVIPPLRSRKEDILALSEYFVSYFNDHFQSNVLGIGKEVKTLMVKFPWKGNVRELKNFIEYLFNFITTGWITMEAAGELIHRKLDIDKKSLPHSSPSFSLVEMEIELIKKALQYVQSQQLNIEDASRLLGIGRATLFRKIKKYQIDI
ncbi:sigma 54-interacting transcriptional regulator [Bacillus sp. DTU_2020_1000418_1_SI_GHA_SEK_038]|uniref:sigma-54-dependent Fis family transcriptional regulator n=1 Tax=Bacillus sp. DTU_2020_1000418_1_SI_GHA_SEK_038 TaxID=3077585 RepID=UPI0028EDF61E|nr:sigma 54-interacting transcriptional regulator [Bacillus sp. DTU_2020_1000418_1_SI_GHA_SEK_038]WNS76456.1 sigma 54-interacting transcriptional regulator [Bacillus sp. DTU_2020_1000418_1_SI_GHA_SEK_038]